MTDEQEFTGDLSPEAITEGMKQAARELHDWISGGNFEQDIRRRGVQIARERAEGIYQSKKQREDFQRIFQDDTSPAEVEKINTRLNELHSKPHLSESEDTERRELTKKLQASMKRYSSGSSKKAKDW